MAKSISQAMEELRAELDQAKQNAGQLQAKGKFDEIAILERFIKDAEEVLVRW